MPVEVVHPDEKLPLMESVDWVLPFYGNEVLEVAVDLWFTELVDKNSSGIRLSYIRSQSSGDTEFMTPYPWRKRVETMGEQRDLWIGKVISFMKVKVGRLEDN